MKETVPGTHFKFALNDRAPIISAIRCECWDCEDGERFVFAHRLQEGLHLCGS